MKCHYTGDQLQSKSSNGVHIIYRVGLRWNFFYDYSRWVKVYSVSLALELIYVSVFLIKLEFLESRDLYLTCLCIISPLLFSV